MKLFRVGIDSYGLFPLNLDPFEVMDWAISRGAEGVHFSHVNLKDGQRLDTPFLGDLAQYAGERDLYLEWGGGQHIPFDLETWKPKDLFEGNKAAAEQAEAMGTRVIRSCSGGLMRWKDDSLPTDDILRAMAKALIPQKSLFIDHNVILAIELHFEFTTFELLRLFDMCGVEPGGPFGICLDTMNLLTMLEDPLSATERILPWVKATHIKDGGMLLKEEGLVSFTAEAGSGLVDLKSILELLSTLEETVHLSIEDHGGSFPIPIFEAPFLERFPDLTAFELSLLIRLGLMGNRLLEEGRLAPLDRGAWPAHCESRLASGIKNLKRMVEEMPGTVV